MAKKAASKTVVAKRVAKSKSDPTKATKPSLPKEDGAKLTNTTVKSQSISPEQVRAWLSFRQGLDQVRSELTAEQILERYGWARSVAGVGPYLTLFTHAGIKRQAADDAVAKLKIHELLLDHAIFDRGRLVGLFLFDPVIASFPFPGPNAIEFPQPIFARSRLDPDFAISHIDLREKSVYPLVAAKCGLVRFYFP